MKTRMVLRQGMKGTEVRELQKTLNKVLQINPPLLVDGDFGSKTFSAVTKFQKKSLLKSDGIVGNNTWEALDQAVNPNPIKIEYSPQAPLADIAATYIGTKETSNNLMGNDPKMKEIFEADRLTVKGKTDGYPWCAAFVSLCVQKLLKGNLTYISTVPPREASVSRFLNIWAKQQNCTIFKYTSKKYSPQKGDIVIYTFSHIGIVEQVYSSYFIAIEGNTNNNGSREGIGVMRRNRSYSNTRAFIRLPLSLMDLPDKVDQYSRWA